MRRDRRSVRTWISAGICVLLAVLLQTAAAAQSNTGKAVRVPQATEVKRAQIQARRFLLARLDAANREIARQRARVLALQRLLDQERELIRRVLAMERAASALKPFRPSPDRKVEAELAARLKDAEEAIKQEQARADAIRHQIGDEEDLDRRLSEAQAKAKPADPEAKLKAELLEKIARAKQAQAADEAELEKLPKAIADAQAALATAQGTAVSVPFGVGRFHPVYIECQESGITIYKPQGTDVTEVSVDKDSIDNSDDLKSIAKGLADDAKNGGAEVINFLVRPGGVKTYDSARVVVTHVGAPWTSVPISANGKVRIGQKIASHPAGSPQEARQK